MNISLRKDLGFFGALFVLSAFLYGTNLGSFGLLDPDEPFYSLTAKEMVERGDASTPVIFGSPQFEKPILFYWVMYACFKIFGISEWSARLGPCIAGILIVLITYLWGRVLFRRPVTAFISAAVLATAGEFIVVSRIVLTDIYLCLFVTAALYAFSLGYFQPRHRKIAWYFLFVFAALGLLTKGMLGFLLPFMAIGIFLVVNGEIALLAQVPWLSGGMLFALIGFPWFALMTAEHGTWFLKHFFIHENIRRFFVAEHKSFDRYYFYPGGIFLGFFPWSFAVVAAIAYGFRQAARKTGMYRREFLLLFVTLASFFIFFMMAKSKLLSYIFPVFPAIALLVGGWGQVFAKAIVRRGAALKTPFLLLAAVVLGALPAVMGVGVLMYSFENHLGLEFPVILFSLTVVPLMWTALVLLWKKKVKPAFFLILAGSAVFSMIAFNILLPKADSFFASDGFVKIYEKDAAGKAPRVFIAGKLFVRGVSFYSGNKKMAVLTDNPRGVFYTKHALPMISSTQDLINLGEANYPVYCFLRAKEFRFLKTIVNDQFKITMLEDKPQRALARLDWVK